jgi:hypothetical protein
VRHGPGSPPRPGTGWKPHPGPRRRNRFSSERGDGTGTADGTEPGADRSRRPAAGSRLSRERIGTVAGPGLRDEHAGTVNGAKAGAGFRPGPPASTTPSHIGEPALCNVHRGRKRRREPREVVPAADARLGEHHREPVVPLLPGNLVTRSSTTSSRTCPCAATRGSPRKCARSANGTTCRTTRFFVPAARLGGPEDRLPDRGSAAPKRWVPCRTSAPSAAKARTATRDAVSELPKIDSIPETVNHDAKKIAAASAPARRSGGTRPTSEPPGWRCRPGKTAAYAGSPPRTPAKSPSTADRIGVCRGTTTG